MAQTTGFLLENVFIEAIAAYIDMTDNIQHFHSDDKNRTYPLVFVKATLDEQDPTEIKLAGKIAEIYEIMIGSEWPLEDESGVNVDKLARQCREAIDDPAANPPSLSEFRYLRMERKEATEREIEPNVEDEPTRRFEMDTFKVTVIRA